MIMEENTKSKLSSTMEMTKTEKSRSYPHFCTNGQKYVKLVNDHQGYEKINGTEEWTNYGSAELCHARLKDYTPCSRENYLTAQ